MQEVVTDNWDMAVARAWPLPMGVVHHKTGTVESSSFLARPQPSMRVVLLPLASKVTFSVEVVVAMAALRRETLTATGGSKPLRRVQQ